MQRLPETYQLDLHLQCGLLELYLPSHEFYHGWPCQDLPQWAEDEQVVVEYITPWCGRSWRPLWGWPYIMSGESHDELALAGLDK